MKHSRVLFVDGRDLQEELKAACKACDIETIRNLLAQGADAGKEKYEEGTWGACHRESPIHTALKSHQGWDTRDFWKDENNANKYVDMIQALLEAGAKVNAVYEEYDWRGCGSKETAFQIALGYAMAGNQAWRGRLLALFLEHGADPNTPCVHDAHTMRYDGSERYAPLHSAARHGNVSCLKALLDAGADANAVATERGQSEYGHGTNTHETALHIVLKSGGQPYYDYEEEEDSDDDSDDDSDKKARSKEVRSKEDEEAARLARIAKQKEARQVAQASISEMVAMLLAAGADVNAVRKEIDNVSVQLTEEEMQVDDPRDDKYVPRTRQVHVRETALHIAIGTGNALVVKQLLAAGASLHATREYDKKQQTVWDLCESLSNEEAKAAVREALTSGWTPSSHKFYPAPFKHAVKALLLCALREQWPLPKELVLMIVQKLATVWA